MEVVEAPWTGEDVNEDDLDENSFTFVVIKVGGGGSSSGGGVCSFKIFEEWWLPLMEEDDGISVTLSCCSE